MPATMLERLTDRLGTLWAESDNPMAEMRSAASRFLEAELSDQQPSPRQSPREFARMLIEDNPPLLYADETAYVEKLFPHDHSLEDALLLLEIGRRQFARVLRKLPPEAFDLRTITAALRQIGR